MLKFQKCTMNQRWNLNNPNQGLEPRVLFLCSAGLLRSATAAQIFCQEPWNWNTRNAGVSQDYALIPVSEALIRWADAIFVMEQEHVNALWQIVTSEFDEETWLKDILPKVRVLNIPDVHMRMADELVTVLVSEMNSHLNEGFVHFAEKR